MKTLFYYCYYRISQGYRSFDDSDYLDWGYRVLFATFAFAVASIAVPVSRLWGAKPFTRIEFILLLIPLTLLYVCTFFISEKRKMDLFYQLEERYKNELHKTLKGWLVALYAVGTFVLYIVMCAIFA